MCAFTFEPDCPCESCDPPAYPPMPAYSSEAYARYEIRREQAHTPEDDR